METVQKSPFSFFLSLLKPLVLLFQAHLVAAFEQSLGNMTIRLKSLTLTAEQKVRGAGNGVGVGMGAQRWVGLTSVSRRTRS